MPRTIKHTFAGGEITDSLIGRTDLDKLQTGAAYLNNFLVERFGGISNRPGTKYVANTLGNAQAHLIPFTFSSTQSYVLSFTDSIMRVITNGGIVVANRVASGTYKWTASGSGTNEYYMELAAGGDPSLPGAQLVYENGTLMTSGTLGALSAGQYGHGDNDALGYSTLYVRLTDGTDPNSKADGYIQSDVQVSTPYTYAQAKALRFAQSFDVLYLAHPNFPLYKVTRLAASSWTISQHSLASTLSAPSSTVLTWSGTGVTNRTSYYQISTLSSDDEESAPTSALSVETVFPWPTNGQVAIYWNSIRTAATYKWTLSGSGTNEYYLELLAGGDPSIAEPTTVYENELAMTEGTVGSLAAGEYAHGDNDALGFNTIYVRLSGAAADPDDASYYDGYLTIKKSGEDRYRLYKNYRGYYGWIGDVQTPWYVDDQIEPDINDSPFITYNPFNAASSYPKAVALYEQRLCAAGTTNEPQTFWASYLGAYNNFGYKQPNSSADSIEATLASGQLEDIRWMVVGRKLLLFTGNGSWAVEPTVNAASIGPDTIRFTAQEFDGITDDVKPLLINRDVMFLEEDKKRCNVLYYGGVDFDGYVSENVSLLAEHLFEGRTVEAWTYQQYPSSVVWAVLSDGTALSLTYLREQKIAAWARHSTDGDFESVQSIFNGSGGSDVYWVVERTINGSTVRFIEWMQDRYFSRVQDAFHVDAGLTYDNPLSITGITQANPGVVTSASHGLSDGDHVYLSGIGGMTELAGWYYVANATTHTFTLQDYNDSSDIDTTSYTAYTEGGYARKGVLTVSGLGHLEGQDVAIVADGAVIANPENSTLETQAVSSGSITLPGRAATVHVGLPFVAEVQTLRLTGGGGADLQALRKSITKVWLRVKDSVLGSVGPTSSAQKDIKQRQYEDWREPTAALTGDISHIMTQSWNREGQVYYKQIDPLPITILALIMETQLGNR